MKKIIMAILLITGVVNGSELQTKYEIFTEYLGMKQLELDEKQLSEIVPKLEATMMKDKNYKELLLQNKLAKLNSTIKKPLEQTICFSYFVGVTEELKGPSCGGKTLEKMNADGWELVQIITGLSSNIGYVFTRK
jgi:hypothetical protein